ncbi:uncharacterized protein LOC118349876 [Juglans regia]|uniref:Uncharacterized protein LOC118349876 n=1 Tax=Juglans regia TaxID=51240 RepID=A0A6P9ESB2_JUGRE|nr:uncharacterized protein LOC118349876 [Juglans regia]
MAEFSEFIFDLDLMDLSLVGSEYTWSNSRIWSKLDRLLVSPSWEAHYPKVSQKMLARVSLDHFPILLDCGGIQRGRRYFKFENMWLKANGFVELELKGKELLGDGLEEVFFRKATVVTELERVLFSVERSWRQKSRALWLKEGDRCTKFFHKVVNSHRRNNAIESLHSGTQVLSSPPKLANHIAHYYGTLLIESATLRPKLDALSFEAIDPQNVSVLERPFDEKEIFKVISSMAKDKAWSPDGLSMGFFQTCWDVVKGEVLLVFSEFHTF